MFHEYRGPERQKSDTALLNWLEPSYLYYAQSHNKTPGILLSASTDAEPSLPAPAGKAVPNLFKPDLNSDALPAYITVRSIDPNNQNPFLIPTPHIEQGSLCYDRGLVKKLDTDELVGKKPLYMKQVKLTDPIGTPRPDDIILAFRLVYDTALKPLKPLCEYSVSKLIQPPRPRDQFYASKMAQTKGVSYTAVNFFEGKSDIAPTYLIRKPLAGTRVYQDWVQEQFTDDEANFLNGLGITPQILADVFKTPGVSWQVELAQYLEGITITKCFKDNALMLRGECERNRKFMDTLRTYFAQNQLSVEAIQEKQDKAMQAEIKRYLDDVEASRRGAMAVEFPAASEGLLPLEDPLEFVKLKKTMGNLFVYTEISTDKDTESNASSNIIVVNTRVPNEYKLYKLSVPLKDYETNSYIFYDRLEQIRKKYPAFTFIY
jgi:hypothetical protein